MHRAHQVDIRPNYRSSPRNAANELGAGDLSEMRMAVNEVLLLGQVEAVQFNALMAGIDPTDERLERRLRDSRGEPKLVGFDLTPRRRSRCRCCSRSATSRSAGS